MLISSSVKGHALFGLLPLPCCLSCFCFAFKASRVKLNDTSFIPVAMIECPYFVRRSFLSTLLMIERKVYGSKLPPSFFLTVKRKLARSGSNSFGGIKWMSLSSFFNRNMFSTKLTSRSVFFIVFLFCWPSMSCWISCTDISIKFHQILEELHFHQMVDKEFHLENYLLMEIL